MQRFMSLFVLSLLFSAASAQTRTPIRVETFPAVPRFPNPQTDKLASSRVSEDMPFVAPILLETADFTNTLVLANAASVEAMATITVYSVDGVASPMLNVKLQPHEKREYPLASLSSLPVSTLGSVMVKQGAPGMGVVVAGQVIATDRRASLPAYLDEELAMPEMEGSSTLRAVTDQAEAAPVVAVTNIAATQQQISLTCLRAGAAPVTRTAQIAGHATVHLLACGSAPFTSVAAYLAGIQDSSSEGVFGLEVTGSGDPGTLAAFALAPHRRGQDLIFSAVPFNDPEMLHSSDVVFAGVPIGAQQALPTGVYVPRVSLANFSDRPETFSISLADTRTSPVRDANGNGDAPPLSLLKMVSVPARSTAEYVFSGQEAQSGLLHSVVVSGTGRSGSAEAKLVSRSTGSLFEIELLAKDSKDINNAGVHPWSVVGDAESHIVLFNHGKAEKKVGVFINAGSTTLWSREFYLAANETREISINQLQRDKVRDDEGRVLALDQKDGVVDWMTPDSGDVTGRLMVTSRTQGVARNFSCGNTKGECQLNFYHYFEFTNVGDTRAMYSASASVCINHQPTQCQNANQTNGTVSYRWTVGDASVIQLSDNSQTSLQKPTLSGMSGGGGTATVVASAGQCGSTGIGYPTVQQPDHLSVASDNTTQYFCPAGNSDHRAVSYNVLDTKQQQIQRPISVLETVDPGTTSSCNGTTVTTSYACTPIPVSGGTPGNFTDTLDPGCPNTAQTAQGCGYTFPHQVWEWCNPVSVPTSIGTIGKDDVFNTIISLGGSTQFTEGQTFPK